MYKAICDALHRELEMLDEKYSGGKVQVNSSDLETIDKVSHALKCMKTVEAMEGSSEWDGDSYARGRSRVTGRYISREADGSGYYPRYESERRY
jgi:hypothetical protein